jgi:hypothetical protein
MSVAVPGHAGVEASPVRGDRLTGGAPVAQGPWFYCLKHHTVETRDGCAERHRLGPYDTREEAEHALQGVAERNEKLDQEDREWEGR